MAAPQIAGVPVSQPAAPPDQFLADLAKDHLGFWTRNVDRVRSAVEALDGALEALGTRTGEREDAARAWLTGHRDRIGAALAAYESWDATSSTLAAEIQVRRDARAAAEARGQSAGPKEAVKAADALTVELALGRELGRTIQAAVDAIAFPQLHGLDGIAEAEKQTRALVGTRQPMRRLHTALDQGAGKIDRGQYSSASRGLAQTVAVLWVCWESDPAFAHEFSCRHARYREGG